MIILTAASIAVVVINYIVNAISFTRAEIADLLVKKKIWTIHASQSNLHYLVCFLTYNY